MAASKDDIFRNALGLPETGRADLIGALINSLDAEIEAGVEEAWRVEKYEARYYAKEAKDHRR